MSPEPPDPRPEDMARTLVPGLVSIVMPVFNGAALIRTAIDSALAQTYANWELIVVDDGSTDETARLVEAYEDTRIRYTFQTNRGQAAALNRGLDMATGEYVTTLDADDWLTEESLACRVACLARDPGVGVVYGDGVYRYETGETGPRFTELMPAGVTGNVFDTLVVSPFYGTGAAVIVRHSVLGRHQIRYDETIKWCQDWDLYIRLAGVADFGFVDTVVINYRVHGAGMTQTMPTGERMESLIRLRQKVLAMPRFARTSTVQKAAFFYDYLARDLNGKVDLQNGVLTGAPFGSLPEDQQGRLIRLTATSYLARNEHLATVKVWLRLALRTRPTDLKTLAVALLLHASPFLAGHLVTRWQGRGKPRLPESPFERAALKQV